MSPRAITGFPVPVPRGWPYVNASPLMRFNRLPFPEAPLPRSEAPHVDRFQVVYVNDIHGKFRPLTRLKTAVEALNQEARQQGLATLTVSGGDEALGQNPVKNAMAYRLHEMLGVRYAVLGNHNLDTGVRRFARFLKNVRFTTLANNLFIPADSPLRKRLYDGQLSLGPQVHVTASGQRYGILGSTTPDLHQLMNPDVPMAGVTSFDFATTRKLIQADVEALARRGVRRNILISHLGYDHDRQIAQTVNGIGLIVGGHSHTELEGIVPGVNLFYNPQGKPVLIVQTGKDAHALGRLICAWNERDEIVPERSHNRLYNPAHFRPDRSVTALVRKIMPRNRVIAASVNHVNNDHAAAGGENGFANALTAAARQVTDAEIAFVRGVDIRNSVDSTVLDEAGRLDRQALDEILPYPDKLVTVRMTGRQVQTALDTSAQAVNHHRNVPGMLHAAGLTYDIDPVADRATNVRVWDRMARRWQPLEPARTYRVTIDHFIATNPYEYLVFKASGVVRLKTHNFSARDAFERVYTGQPLHFREEGRVRRRNPFRVPVPS